MYDKGEKPRMHRHRIRDRKEAAERESHTLLRPPSGTLHQGEYLESPKVGSRGATVCKLLSAKGMLITKERQSFSVRNDKTYMSTFKKKDQS